jgi:hypothetical protein
MLAAVALRMIILRPIKMATGWDKSHWSDIWSYAESAMLDALTLAMLHAKVNKN